MAKIRGWTSHKTVSFGSLYIDVIPSSERFFRTIPCANLDPVSSCLTDVSPRSFTVPHTNLFIPLRKENTGSTLWLNRLPADSYALSCQFRQFNSIGLFPR